MKKILTLQSMMLLLDLSGMASCEKVGKVFHEILSYNPANITNGKLDLVEKVIERVTYFDTFTDLA